MNRKETRLLVENWRNLVNKNDDILNESVQSKLATAAFITASLFAPLTGQAKKGGYEGPDSKITKETTTFAQNMMNTFSSMKKYSKDFDKKSKEFNKNNTELDLSAFQDNTTMSEGVKLKISFAVASLMYPDELESNKFFIPTFVNTLFSKSEVNFDTGNKTNLNTEETVGLNKLGNHMLKVLSVIKSGNASASKDLANQINYLNYLASQDPDLMTKTLNLVNLEDVSNKRTSVTGFAKYLAELNASAEDYLEWSKSGDKSDFENWISSKSNK